MHLRHSLCALLAFAAALPTFAPLRAAEDFKTMFEKHEFAGSGEGTPLRYRLMRPTAVEEGKKYPLVLFLHGAGERGSDNEAQLKWGMADFATEEARNKYPAYVLAPQCPTGEKWSNVDWSARESSLPEKASDSMGLTLQVIEKMLKEEPIDPARIYITGLSMGGYGTWDALARRPELWAAAIPICGGGDPATVERFKAIPIWCFHGDADTAVRVERSRQMIEALKKAGVEPKYTEYPGVGHNSWSATYANPEVHAWLFAQRRAAE